jgi:hypothetical protein
MNHISSTRNGHDRYSDRSLSTISFQCTWKRHSASWYANINTVDWDWQRLTSTKWLQSSHFMWFQLPASTKSASWRVACISDEGANRATISNKLCSWIFNPTRIQKQNVTILPVWPFILILDPENHPAISITKLSRSIGFDLPDRTSWKSRWEWLHVNWPSGKSYAIPGIYSFKVNGHGMKLSNKLPLVNDEDRNNVAKN